MPIGNDHGAETSSVSEESARGGSDSLLRDAREFQPASGRSRESETFPSPGHERRGGFVKSLIITLLGVLAVLQYQLWQGDRGMPGVHRLEAAVASQHEENVRLEARNRRLSAEVLDLKEGFEAVEERARTNLGMIGRDEIFYQVLEP